MRFGFGGCLLPFVNAFVKCGTAGVDLRLSACLPPVAIERRSGTHLQFSGWGPPSNLPGPPIFRDRPYMYMLWKCVPQELTSSLSAQALAAATALRD